MKKQIRASIPLFLALCLLVGNLMTVHAAEIAPRYTGLASFSAGLTISTTGKASCSGNVSLRSGYTADVTVELKQDGSTIQTWTSSGSIMINAGGSCYVTSGHSYVVTTTVTVYDSDGNVVDNPSKDSPVKNY